MTKIVFNLNNMIPHSVRLVNPLCSTRYDYLVVNTYHTVHLTLSGNLVLEDQEFCLALSKTIVGQVKKLEVSLGA
jgi:hypothetical protein